MYVCFLFRRAWVWHKTHSIISAEKSAIDCEERIAKLSSEVENLLRLAGLSDGYLTWRREGRRGWERERKREGGRERERESNRY